MCILNLIKIRWQITEILDSKVLAEHPVQGDFESYADF
jgi:hypothetical protein